MQNIQIKLKYYFLLYKKSCKKRKKEKIEYLSILAI